jgi:polynucleotide 5'-kinase involved in rRNA processing
LASLAGARPVTLDLGRVVLRAPALYAGTPLSLRETEALASRLNDAVLWAERCERVLIAVTPGRLREHQLRDFAAGHPEMTLVNHSLDDFHDVLAGLDAPDRQTIGLGIVRAVDFTKQAMVVETPVPEGAIAGIRLGEYRIR